MFVTSRRSRQAVGQPDQWERRLVGSAARRGPAAGTSRRDPRRGGRPVRWPVRAGTRRDERLRGRSVRAGRLRSVAEPSEHDREQELGEAGRRVEVGGAAQGDEGLGVLADLDESEPVQVVQLRRQRLLAGMPRRQLGGRGVGPGARARRGPPPADRAARRAGAASGRRSGGGRRTAAGSGGRRR